MWCKGRKRPSGVRVWGVGLRAYGLGCVHPSIHPSIHLAMCLSVYLSFCLPACPSPPSLLSFARATDEALSLSLSFFCCSLLCLDLDIGAYTCACTNMYGLRCMYMGMRAPNTLSRSHSGRPWPHHLGAHKGPGVLLPGLYEGSTGVS